MKLHLLGVKDPDFMEQVDKLLENNAHTLANNSDRYPVYFFWRNLQHKKIHRQAMNRRLEMMLESPHLLSQIASYQLMHYFWAACELEQPK